MRLLRDPLPCTDVDEASPLTLIASMTIDGAILLAADSLAREDDDTPRTVEKLYRLPNLPVVWGFSGESLIGVPFSKWMLTQPWPLSLDWPQFADQVSHEVNRRNRESRQSAEEAGTKAESDQLITVLMGGLLGGELEVWRFFHNGLHAQIEDRFYAIGTGSSHAWTAFRALQMLERHSVFTTDAFDAIVQTAVALDYKSCGPPVKMMCVSAARGAEDVPVKE